MLTNGIPYGLSTGNPFGGQTQPMAIVGARLEWKYAQKIEKKNMASEIIKRIIPSLSPLTTFFVWKPIKVPSRTTSLHHRPATVKVKNMPKKRISLPKG